MLVFKDINKRLSRFGAELPELLRYGLPWLVLILFGVIMTLSLALPVYIDDIVYPMTSSRAGYDGWLSIHAFPQCGSTFLTPIPVTLLPGRALAWLTHAIAGNYIAMRAICIFLVAAWLAYGVYVIKTCFAVAQPYRIAAGIVAFSSLGTLPLMLVLNRPEMAMILAVTLFASMPFLMERYGKPRLGVMLAIAGLFLLACSWFVSSHPKALFYAPLLLVCAAMFSRWHKNAGPVMGAVVVWMHYQSWQGFWRLKTSCPGSAGGTQRLENSGLSPTRLANNPPGFIRQLLTNILDADRYIQGIFFTARAGFRDRKITAAEQMLNDLLYISVLGMILWALGMSAAVLYRSVKARQWTRPDALIIASLLSGCAGQLMTQSIRSFYNASLVLLTISLCGALAMFSLRATLSVAMRQCMAAGLACLLAVSVLSQYTLLASYVPPIARSLRNANSGIITSRWAEISPLEYEDTAADILRAANACNIAPDESSRHVMIDPGTYMAMKNTYQPYRIVFRYREFNPPHKLFSFLKNAGSSGLITYCKTLPDGIYFHTQRHGAICCMSKAQIHDAAR